MLRIMPVLHSESLHFNRLKFNIHGNQKEKLESLIYFKNEVIGYIYKKDRLINEGLVPTLTLLLQQEHDEDLIVQACIILGSLAYAQPDNVKVLLEYQSIDILLSLLQRFCQESIIENILRAIKNISITLS